MTTHNYGIDYSGPGSTVNRDPDNGIRYGVIHMNDLAHWAWGDFKADYGPPTCPKCGNEAVNGDSDVPAEVLEESGVLDPFNLCDRSDDLGYKTLHGACGDYACDNCKILFDGEDAYGDEPRGHYLDDGEYKASVDSINDVFVIKSPYYTHAQFCSPCAPGACHLANPTDEGGPKAYCLGHEWFEDGVAPYTVYRVSDNTVVEPEKK